MSEKSKQKEFPGVPKALEVLADIYEERNKVYGDNYKFFGEFVAPLFPEGLTIKTSDDWSRLGVLIQMLSKISRYANQFSEGGHADSLDDLSVYSQMLQELDAMKCK